MSPDKDRSQPPEGTLGWRVFQLRKKLGSVARELSYADFARVLSEEIQRRPPISASSIQRWENGADPDPRACVAMARMAGIATDAFILGGDGSGPVRDPAPVPAPPTVGQRDRARERIAAHRRAAKQPAKKPRKA